jgi:hypothetical protein
MTVEYADLEPGKTFTHRTLGRCRFIAIYPDCGATLVMEELDREDGEICCFFICERFHLDPAD